MRAQRSQAVLRTPAKAAAQVRFSVLTAPLSTKHSPRQIRTFWCPMGMHNYASSRAIGAGAAVLIVSPEWCSRARWDVVNKLSARSAGASGYAPLVSWAYLRSRRE
jgi:hypothetical protein